ncbi:hypothetical protein B0T22DRAFT_457258 [Podospora appendiculata]|uniref:Uncharacterized protein n=1 Tax=Podospora appendiculata TaxID=314037 RepID=A0AAE0X7D8_9PEZI|nr:hypothetical protein B0T22DRAFT_457258 [Podospora appendiculata]
MSLTLNIRGLATRLFARPRLPTPTTTTTARFTTLTPVMMARFDSSANTFGGKAGLAAKQKRTAKKGSKGEQRDPKMINMLKHFAILSPRRIPPPLRMARNRHLRHWTIHRAWLLFRRREREGRERTLMRQYQGMYAACEALRLSDGPGTRETGYLYRVAMEKKGVYGHHGVPIEYARPQTETPARTPWNHDWKL